MSDREQEKSPLSDAEKFRVDSYLRSRLIPTGIVVGLLGLVVGFLVNEVARGLAYATAIEKHSTQLQTVATEVGEASGRVVSALSAIELAKGQAETARSKAQQVAGEVRAITDQAANSLQLATKARREAEEAVAAAASILEKMKRADEAANAARQSAVVASARAKENADKLSQLLQDSQVARKVVDLLSQSNEVRSQLVSALEVETRDIQVPVGSIIAFWGDAEDIEGLSENFELCDGTPVVHEQSPFHNELKPDLIGRFLLGTNVEETSLSYTTGGSLLLPRLKTTPYTLTNRELPTHSHYASAAPHAHALQHSQFTHTGSIYKHGGDHRAIDRGTGNLTIDEAHIDIGISREGQGEEFSLTIAPAEFMPLHQEVVFLMRVY